MVLDEERRQRIRRVEEPGETQTQAVTYRYMLKPGDGHGQWAVECRDEQGLLYRTSLFWDQGQAARFALENNRKQNGSSRLKKKKYQCASGE